MADIEKSIPTSTMLMPNFTTRQREIAQYATRNGYLETPKRITAQEIAKHFGISVSAMNEHLRKVEGIALRYFFS
jgi:predicted DNA binding protein